MKRRSKKRLHAVISFALVFSLLAVSFFLYPSQAKAAAQIYSLGNNLDSPASDGTNQNRTKETAKIYTSKDPQFKLASDGANQNKVKKTAETSALQKDSHGLGSDETNPAKVKAAAQTATSGNYQYELDSDGNAVITKYVGSEATVTIPGALNGHTVVALGSYAFKDLKSLKSITIPETVTSIGAGAFANTGLTSLKLPKNLVKMSRGVLSGTTGVTEITVPKTVTTMEEVWEGSFRGSSLEKVTFESGMAAIPAHALQGCKELTSVSIPNTVTEIKGDAFEGCTSLTKVSIPDTVTSIGASAFQNTGLTSLKLPKNLVKMSQRVLSGTTGVTEITVPKTVVTMDGDWKGSFCGSSLKKVTFESGMEAIPAYALQGCKELTSVSIPNTVTEIKGHAFADCTSITSNIEIPSIVTEIGDSVFKGCTSLTRVSIPDSVKAIGASAFENTGLTRLKLPKNLAKMSQRVLSGTTGVTEITVPKTVVTMDGDWKGSFCGSSLKKVTFESGMEAIPAYALQGCKELTSVSIPNTVTEIKGHAFADCTSLTSLKIPNNVNTIGSNAFANCTSLLAYCNYYANGVIACIENGIDFAPSDEKFVDHENKVVDREKSMYYANMNSVSANGYLPFTVNFGVKKKWEGELSDRKVVIYIPKYTELVEKSIKLDGKLVKDFQYNDSSRQLTIPVNKDSGKISFSIEIKSKENVTTYAYLAAKKNGKATIENINAINETFSGITLSAASNVNSDKVKVSGIAPAATDISLYVDGKKQGTVKSLKNGSWSGTATIKDPKEYYTYLIEARCVDESGVEISAVANVSYRASAPEVQSFVVEYNEHSQIKTCDILDSSGVKPQIYFLPGSELVFKVGLENRENLGKVYVTSTRNNEKKTLEASYDTKTGLYVTKGYFDETNTSYVPGTLSVEYTEKGKPVQATETYDVQGFKQLLGKELQNADVVYEKKTKDEVIAKVNLGEVLLEDASDAYVDAAIRYVDVAAGTSLEDTLDGIGITANALSYIVPGINDEKYVYQVDWSDPENLLMVAYDASKIIDKVASVKLSMTETMAGNYMDLLDKATTASYIAKGLGFAYNAYGIIKDYNELVDDINQSSSITDKAGALKKAEELRNNQLAFSAIMAVLPLIAGPEMAGAALIFSGLVAVMTGLSEQIFAMRAGNIKAGKYKLNWIVDPSGIVTDAGTGAPLGDAKMTAYWIPYDDTDGFWSKQPSLEEHGQIWDALEYEQRNPLNTNVDGKYAWDVPEGWWRVKCEKEGYQTAWSHWMTVPPVQTEVHFALKKISSGTPGSGSKNGKQGRSNGKVKVSSIKLTGISHKIAAGKKIKLTARVFPSNAANKAVTWRSGKTKVAKVNRSGVVTVKKKTGGKKAIILAIAADGSGVKARYKITSMKGVVKKVSISGKRTVKAGKSLKLKAKVKATKKANKKLRWRSSNAKYAKVSGSGKVKTYKAGKGRKVKIMAMATDGSRKKDSVTIKIK